jgi:hypothetical protein
VDGRGRRPVAGVCFDPDVTRGTPPRLESLGYVGRKRGASDGFGKRPWPVAGVCPAPDVTRGTPPRKRGASDGIGKRA